MTRVAPSSSLLHMKKGCFSHKRVILSRAKALEAAGFREKPGCRSAFSHCLHLCSVCAFLLRPSKTNYFLLLQLLLPQNKNGLRVQRSKLQAWISYCNRVRGIPEWRNPCVRTQAGRRDGKTCVESRRTEDSDERLHSDPLMGPGRRYGSGIFQMGDFHQRDRNCQKLVFGSINVLLVLAEF